MENIGQQIARGAAWMVLFKLAERTLGVVSTVLLARLLLPSDFGLLAMATSVIAALELFSAFSFDMALIQNQTATRDDYDSAWTLQLAFAAGSALLLVGLAHPFSAYYDEPRLRLVMYSLALGWFIKGFENIGVVDFRKGMQFDKEFYFLFGRKVAAFAVAIPLAVIFRNYWALVAGIMMQRIASVAISYALHSFRPRLSLRSIGSLYRFSKWILINNSLLFIRRRLSDFVIGRILGARMLGLYTIGYEISNMAMTELVAPMNRAIYPGLAKQAGELEQLRQTFLNVLSVLWLIALPMAFGIAVTAELLVPIALGDRWLDATPLIRILAVYGGLNVVVGNVTYIWIAQGRPALAVLFTSFQVVVLVPLLIIFTQQYGLLGAAWASLMSTLIALPFNYLMICRTLKIKLGELFAKIWRPLAATSVMFYMTFIYIYGQEYTGDFSNSIIALAIAIIIGIVTYTGCVLLLWKLAARPDGAEKMIIDQLRTQFWKSGASPSNV